MAVAPNDLRAPKGKVEASLFPGEASAALDERLQAYIDDGAAKSSALTGAAKDAATKAWAYHRAFDAVFIRLANQPQSVSLADQGSKSYGAKQAEYFKQLAEQYGDEFSMLVVGTATVESALPPTTFTANRIVW